MPYCVRPPLVYGLGVKANFRLLMKWVQRGVPPPGATPVPSPGATGRGGAGADYAEQKTGSRKDAKAQRKKHGGRS